MDKKRTNAAEKLRAELQSNFGDGCYFSWCVSCSVFLLRPESVTVSGTREHWALFWNRCHFGNVKSLLPDLFFSGLMRYKKALCLFFLDKSFICLSYSHNNNTNN